ncbi:MAG: hypothetical protein ACI4BA_01420 [Prevotella sp.]
MENLRRTLRILFHSQRPQSILKNLKANPKRFADAWVDDKAFVRQMSYLDDANMSLDNASIVLRHLREQWMTAEKDCLLTYAGRDTVFNVLLHFSSKVLVEKDGMPVCHYEHLLRWHDLSSLLSEDLLTTSFLAAHDLCRNYSRQDFCWLQVIGHDNRMLNEMFTKPMADLHFHLNGSSMNFELNWLNLMNKTCGWEESFGKLTQKQNVALALTDKYGEEDLYLSVMKAAAIRIVLFDYVVKGKNMGGVSSRLMTEARAVMDAGTVEEAVSHVKVLDLEKQGMRRMYAKRYIGDDLSARIPDYAISDQMVKAVSKGDKDYVLTVLCGERWLMYQLFRDIYERTNIDKEIVGWFYAYLVLKSQFRTEIVQMNRIVGFDNFARYEERKSLFIGERSVYASLLSQMAAMSFLHTSDNRWLEARITPKKKAKELNRHLEKAERDITNSHFMTASVGTAIGKQYGFVLHFIKRKDDGKTADAKKGKCRHANLRYFIKKQADAINALRHSLMRRKERVLGIDAANSEVLARPEVFAQAFRYLRESHAMKNNGSSMKDLGMTYHVGEDFLDIVDGLRAVDEVLHFMGFRNGDRLGHGMVLGIDVKAYYAECHGFVLMPAQVLLDNVAWLYYKGKDLPEFVAASKELEVLFATYYQKVFGHLSYHVTLWNYYQSWLLRGDNPMCYYQPNLSGKHLKRTKWTRYNLNDDADARMARSDSDACTLYADYHFDDVVRSKGTETVQVHLSDKVVGLIMAVQEKMLTDVEKMNVCVECNPTSNLKIGHFKSYSTHPIVRMYNYQLPLDLPPHCVSVSINTDDKGIFATSLEREYSLLALSLEKKYVVNGGCSPRQIYEWLDKIRQMSFEQKF